MARASDRPRFSRLPVEERRRLVLERAARLFTRRPYGELSMSQIARESGISKALLYHYFPSKRALFQATLRQAAEELARRTEPDPRLPPPEQLERSLDAFLAWVEENPDLYTALMRGAATEREVGELVAGVRERTAELLAKRLLSGEPSPLVRTAIQGWLRFLNGACLDWLAHRDIRREELGGLLLETLRASLRAAGTRLRAS